MKFDLLYHLISPVTGKLKILLNLGNGLLKTTNDGELSIAIPDEDFATSTTLEQIKSDTEQIKSDTEFYRTEAQIASGTATNAASVATTAAGEASIAAIDANTSMLTATGAAISAAASAQSASNSANSAADSAAQAVQNIPTFNYPLLKTTNTLSCLYDNLTIGLDASNRLKVISGSSQWTTSGSNIYYNVTGGGVGIGTATPSSSYKLDVNGNININGNVNQSQSLYFRGTDYNLGIAGAAGNYSSSAVQNDMILRTLSGTNLILQSGSGSSALKINNNNYVGLNKILQLLIVPADNRTVTETTIINNGGIVGSAFGGDVYLSSYWGVAIGLNYGGSTDGIGGSNNTQSIIPGQSAFTVNLRSSASSTSFDKTLFTVLPSGNVGIGTTPSYKLDVNGNINCTEIYRSGISLTTTLGTKQNTLIATTDLLGVGTSITALNATNITSGTLSTAYGGTGVTTGLTVLNPANLSSAVTVAKGGTGAATLTSGQLLIGNGTTAVLQSANLAWNNTTNTLSATNISGSGTGLTALNATNITSGTLSTTYGGTGVTTGLTVLNPANLSSAVTVAKGGTGATTLTSGQLLIGNGTTAVLQSANLAWNNTTNTLSATNISGSGTGLTALNATNITSGTLSTTYGGTGVTTGLTVLNPANLSSAVTVAKGGTGATTLTSGQLLIGNGTAAVLQSANLIWDNVNNRLGVGISNISSNYNLFVSNNSAIGTIVHDRDLYDHTLSPLTLTNQIVTSTTVLNDPQPILNLCRQGTVSQAYGARATFKLCRYENSGTNSRTRLDLTLANNNYDDVNVLTLRSDGNIGIGTATPSQKLHIDSGCLYITNNVTNPGNNTSASFWNQAGIGPTISGAGFSIQTNGTTERMRITSGGNVGIGITNPNCRLYISSNISTASSVFVMRLACGASADTNTNATILGLGSEANGWSKCGIAHVRTAGYDQGDIVFLNRNTLDNADCSLTDERMRITSGGNVGIGTTPSYKLDVNGNVRVTGNVNTDPGYSMKSGAFFITDKWSIYVGTSPTNVINSLIFFHSDTGINSKWWFNGTQTNTQSEISDYRVKKEIKEIDNPLDKLMLLKPKEYKLCQDKDYNKKFGLIAQDIYETDLNEFVVNNEEEYVANILANGTYNNKLITSDKKLDHMNIDDEIKLVFSNDGENKEYIIDGNDGPFENRYKRRYVKVKSIIDDYTFEISDELDIKEESFLIYGKKVNDFHKLDYHSMYALNIAATQELFKIVQDLKTRI